MEDVRVTTEKLRKEKKHLKDIEYLIGEVKWGKLHLELTIHNGAVTAIEVISRQRVDYGRGSKVKP